MRSLNAGNFDVVTDTLTIWLAQAPVVHTGEWQAIRDEAMPQSDTIEVEDVSLEIPIIGETLVELQEDIRPNLPWAEEHFQERISGLPWNPPPSHVRWPYAQRSNQQHLADRQIFSHTYPERIWPRSLLPDGIRFPTGDLADVIRLLGNRPGTRQAYLPIWFPEDTGASYQQRVPCTLGYHFLLRGGRLKIVYYIRSCDFYRHFRDDVYMAARLAQYVAGEVGAFADRLVMHISSLHIFAAEKARIDEEARIAAG